MSEEEKKQIIVKNTHRGIQKQIEKNISNSFDALNEYIWNSIDAKAKNIYLNLELEKEMLKGNIHSLEITDDGEGIIFDELQEKTFGVFNQSEKEKEIERNHSFPHGKNGYGRFAFIRFCKSATWKTKYKKDNKIYEYLIKIDDKELNKCSPESQKESLDKFSGTKVIFENFIDNNGLIDSKGKNKLRSIRHYILSEFAWVLELNPQLSIYLNNEKISTKELVEGNGGYKEVTISKKLFKIKVVFWRQKLSNELNRYYFLNEMDEEKYTKLINSQKLNGLNLSVFVKSSFFKDYNNFHLRKTSTKKLDNADNIYTDFLEFLENYLIENSESLRDKIVEEKFRSISNKKYYHDLFKTKVEKEVKKPLFEKATKGIIRFAPEIIKNKSDVQNMFILKSIYESLDSEESRESLINILKILSNKSNWEELGELERQLKEYGLKNILSTIKLIEKRFESLKYLEKIIYDKSFYFLESDLQKKIENSFWIFGEEYHLVGAENDKFRKLLEVYYEKILKKSTSEIEKDRLSKKEVDLMISRKDWHGKDLHNTIIEIKKPGKTLTRENLNQIKNYATEISNIREFNSNGESWIFILISDNYNEDVIAEIENKSNLKIGLLMENQKANQRIYVKKWSDVLNDVKYRLESLKRELNLKEEEISKRIEIEIEKSKGDKLKFMKEALK